MSSAAEDKGVYFAPLSMDQQITTVMTPVDLTLYQPQPGTKVRSEDEDTGDSRIGNSGVARDQDSLTVIGENQQNVVRLQPVEGRR